MPEATAFWVRHDVLRVLDALGHGRPPERIRVVTVPPRGVAARCLLDRFATAPNCHPASGTLGTSPCATSRRGRRGRGRQEVNDVLVLRLNQDQYRFVVEDGLRPRLAVARPLSAEAPC